MDKVSLLIIGRFWHPAQDIKMDLNGINIPPWKNKPAIIRRWKKIWYIASRKEGNPRMKTFTLFIPHFCRGGSTDIASWRHCWVPKLKSISDVQCCVYITDGGKWRLCQNIVLDLIALDRGENRRGYSLAKMARNSKKKLAIFAGTSKCLIYVSSLILYTSR